MEARRLFKLVVVAIALVVGADWLMYGVYRYGAARDQKALFYLHWVHVPVRS